MTITSNGGDDYVTNDDDGDDDVNNDNDIDGDDLLIFKFI